MPDRIDCFGLSDPGRVRPQNEDQFLVADLDKSMLVRQTSLAEPDHTRLYGGPRGHLFLVADGIGGTSGGKRASGLAVQSITRYVLNTMPWFFRLGRDQEHDLSDELKGALEDCHRSVVEAAAAEPGHGRMGTTLTMAYVLWPRLYVVHAGDTRAYLLRGGKLRQVTRDHTLAQQMVEAGTLSPEEAGDPVVHVLWNCIGGGHEDLAPEVYKATLQPGDTLLLCSDGLGKYVPDDRIAEVLGRGAAEPAARQLVNEANAAGGSDNITVVVARFPVADEPTPLTAEPPGG